MSHTQPSTVDDFLASLSFKPDSFQIEALRAVSDGKSVVVTAPTGAGKTVVAEGAIVSALAKGTRAFYTTPIKALSNQKFSDLKRLFGDATVGLLTGDNVINGDAPIVVMTTEVLRNMIYEGSDALEQLGIVILDEVHYLADRDRGSVWEEVIIHLPRRVTLVALSATIANPEEFTSWIRARRGDTELVIERTRPVPLTTMFAWRDRHRGGAVSMLPMFSRNGRPNQAIAKITQSRGSRHRRLSTPRRVEIVEELEGAGLLPAIYFVFSRKGCEQTAREVAHSTLRLTTEDERAEIRRVVAERTSHVPEHDLAVLGFDGWLSVLERGSAAHHAGLVPAFKETVEELFLRGLVKLVAATETLAVGINMPARTVVLDSLSKYTGEGHELLQPSDFTQLTGRAGRRGIDTEGTAVVLFSPYVPFERATGIAGTGANALASSFAPTYNMTVNLIARYDRDRATELLAASFANFSTEARRETLNENLHDRRRDVETFTAAAACERGDIWAFYDGGSRSKPASMDRKLLQPGTILDLAGSVFVLANRSWGGGHPKLEFVDAGGTKTSIRSSDLPRSTTIIGSLTLPTPVRISDAAYRNEVAQALDGFVARDQPIALFSSDDPEGVGACPDIDVHIAWVDRARRAQRDVERLERRIEKAEQNDVLDSFERIHAVLTDLGYVKEWRTTSRGEALRRLYNERDLLLAETIRRGLLDGLAPEEFAAATTVFTFETRGGELPPIPFTPFADSFLASLEDIRQEIADVERRRGVDEQPMVDPGFIDTMHGWASGHDLADLFDDDDIRAGDFVRSSRQLLDLIRQIRDGYPQYRSVASSALSAIDRGIVEIGGVA